CMFIDNQQMPGLQENMLLCAVYMNNFNRLIHCYSFFYLKIESIGEKSGVERIKRAATRMIKIGQMVAEKLRVGNFLEWPDGNHIRTGQARKSGMNTAIHQHHLINMKRGRGYFIHRRGQLLFIGRTGMKAVIYI